MSFLSRGKSTSSMSIFKQQPVFFDNVKANNDAFIVLMSSEHERILFYLAKFVDKCFRKRN